MSDFKPIPYTNGRYAINREGTVINTKTGKILTNNYQVSIVFEGKHRSFTRARLLELTFGVKALKPGGLPVQITAKNDNEILHFPSIFAVSQELASILFYSESTIKHKLTRREPVIGDFHLTYSEQRRQNNGI